MELILRVISLGVNGRAPFCAGAVWIREGTHWRCVHAAPILHWMMGAHAGFVKSWLERNHLTYE